MATKVGLDTRRAIIREFRRGNRTKAGLARKYNTSVSTVYRIVRDAGLTGEAPGENMASITAAVPQKLTISITGNTISKEDATAVLKALNAIESRRRLSGNGSRDATETSAVRDLIRWVGSQEEREKEEMRLRSEIEALRGQKEQVQSELSSLDATAEKLQSTIGRMKSAAQNAMDSLSAVEDRLTALEDRMSDDRDLFMIASGIRSMVENGDIDDETLSFIGKLGELWIPEESEINESVRRALMKYLEAAEQKITGWGRV